MKDFLKVFSETVGAIWNQPVFIVKGQSINLGTLGLGLLFLVLSFFLASRISQHIERKILRRFKDIDEFARASIQRLTYYFLLLFFILLSLGFLNVPLTAITVVGGALAFGVGLGAQNIVNNFISGIILMVERPIRIGDVVEVNALQGKVEEIGARSTKIRSTDNTSIVVPNSTFLEKNVLNWTLSDRIVRTVIKVGVAYGSHTVQVQELLLKSSVDHKKVLTQPEPVVVFEDFGDNSLVFELYYYCYVETVLQLKKVASDIRISIDHLFREHDIVIAFPQRVLHLSNSQPFQVELCTSKET